MFPNLINEAMMLNVYFHTAHIRRLSFLSVLCSFLTGQSRLFFGEQKIKDPHSESVRSHGSNETSDQFSKEKKAC